LVRLDREKNFLREEDTHIRRGAVGAIETDGTGDPIMSPERQGTVVNLRTAT